LSPLSAIKIRNRIRATVLRTGDRAYVGKIAKGSAWYNLLKINNAKLKDILQTYATGAKPEGSDVKAASRALKGLLP
jgi:hypothetical protein